MVSRVENTGVKKRSASPAFDRLPPQEPGAWAMPCVDRIQDCLRQVCEEDLKIMLRLFARMLHHHISPDREPLRSLGIERAMDEAMLMIALELHR